MEVTPRFTKWITLLAVALSVMDAAAQGSPPAPPRELTAAVSGSKVVLTWDWHPAPDPAQSFNRGFILEAGSGPGRADLAVMALGVDHTLVVHDVSPGVYYVRTRVRGESAISHPSNEVRVVVGPGGQCGTPPREVAWFHARASSGGAAFSGIGRWTVVPRFITVCVSGASQD